MELILDNRHLVALTLAVILIASTEGFSIRVRDEERSAAQRNPMSDSDIRRFIDYFLARKGAGDFAKRFPPNFFIKTGKTVPPKRMPQRRDSGVLPPWTELCRMLDMNDCAAYKRDLE